jgi:hypothetical protein
MEDAVAIARCRSAGVPKEAFSTTLVKEKCEDIRAYLVEEGYKDKSIVVLTPCHKVDDAVLPFYVLAKELVLLNKKVYCCRLVDIHTALFKDTEEAEQVMQSLERADFIAIDGFYEKDDRAGPYFTPYETSYFISWFIRNHQNGRGFLLHSLQEIAFVGEWWPRSFVAYLEKRSRSFIVGKKGAAV